MNVHFSLWIARRLSSLLFLACFLLFFEIVFSISLLIQTSVLISFGSYLFDNNFLWLLWRGFRSRAFLRLFYFDNSVSWWTSFLIFSRMEPVFYWFNDFFPGNSCSGYRFWWLFSKIFYFFLFFLFCWFIFLFLLTWASNFIIWFW